MSSPAISLRSAADVRAYARTTFLFAAARLDLPSGQAGEAAGWQRRLDASARACGCEMSAFAFVIGFGLEAIAVVAFRIDLAWPVAGLLAGSLFVLALIGKFAGLWRARHRLLRVADEIGSWESAR